MRQDGILPIEMSTDDRPPLDFVPVEADPDGYPCPERNRDWVMIDVIHDGNNVPQRFLDDALEDGSLSQAVISAAYRRERDWGAELVARCLASAMHLRGYWRVDTARVLLDFGRFPGVTPKSADFMSRFAINYPFSRHLSHGSKRAVLEGHYDCISEGMEAAIGHRLVKIAIHTYDTHNPTDTRRPAVSILTRPYNHHRNFELPVEAFDPIFPRELGKITADRILRARIALTLEEAAIPVADNFPYSLPEGSVEVRSQVWHFFRFLQARYDADRPEGRTLPARALVWRMLLDTNLRSTRSHALRSYLHMFRKPPADGQAIFEAARVQYDRIRDYLRERERELVFEYRLAPSRKSSILLEIRKDLVWCFDDGRPTGPRWDDARLIARLLSKAVQRYLIGDRQAKLDASRDRDRRYH